MVKKAYLKSNSSAIPASNPVKMCCGLNDTPEKLKWTNESNRLSPLLKAFHITNQIPTIIRRIKIIELESFDNVILGQE